MNKQLIIKRNSPFNNFGQRLKKSKYLIFMILPAVLFYAIFSYGPMYGVIIAFKKFQPRKGILGSQWIDFENFEWIFSRADFWDALRNTVVIGAGKVLISFAAALTVSLILNEIRLSRFKKVVQTVVTFPHFLSWVVVAGFIDSLFSRGGAVNDIIHMFGGERISFMANGTFFLILLFLSDIWKEAGWSSIVYLATMAGIPPELYEAADIDGATRLQKIKYVTIPSIKATAILLLIMSVGGILSAGFDQIFNLYNEMVYDVSDILDTYIYRLNFANDMTAGQSTAVGLFKSVVSFIMVLATDRIAKACGERGIL